MAAPRPRNDARRRDNPPPPPPPASLDGCAARPISSRHGEAGPCARLPGVRPSGAPCRARAAVRAPVGQRGLRGHSHAPRSGPGWSRAAPVAPGSTPAFLKQYVSLQHPCERRKWYYPHFTDEEQKDMVYLHCTFSPAGIRKKSSGYISTEGRTLSHTLCRPSEPRFANVNQQKMSHLEKGYNHFSSRNPIEVKDKWYYLRANQCLWRLLPEFRGVQLLNGSDTNIEITLSSEEKDANYTVTRVSSQESLQHWQPHYHSDFNCPICLQTATCPVETNCGHIFCGSCLITYWKHGSWLGAISCPLCRQKVILLDNVFCENQQDKPSKQIVHEIRDYNKRFSGQPRQFADYLYDMPLFLHLTLRGIFTQGGLIWIFFLRVIVCSLGTITCLSSPFDIMPEPPRGVLGAADDLVVVFLFLNCMINICREIESEGISMTSSATQSMLSES